MEREGQPSAAIAAAIAACSFLSASAAATRSLSAYAFCRSASAALASTRAACSFALLTVPVPDPEPLPPDSPLWDAPGLIVSPHMSGDTTGWRDDLAEQFCDNFDRWVDGRPLHNVVDKRLGYVPGGG